MPIDDAHDVRDGKHFHLVLRSPYMRSWLLTLFHRGLLDESLRASRVASSTPRRGFLSGAVTLLGSLIAAPLVATPMSGRLNAATVASLRRQVAGSVAWRENVDYPAWLHSMVWNRRKFRRSPDVIVQVESAADVQAALRFAAEHGTKVAVRGGGHSFCGSFLRDGGMLIDVSRLQHLQVDPLRGEATVGPGVLGRSLQAALARHGLAFPTAHCGMVPVSGFLLGGGIGWNSNGWGGLAAHNVVEFELVTADGELRSVSASQDPDLWWAARGGGPGLFACVVGFRIKCFPKPACIRLARVGLPLTRLGDAVEALERIGPTVPRDVELLAAVVTAPTDIAATMPAESRGRLVVLNAVAFGDSAERAATMLEPVLRDPSLRAPLFVDSGRDVSFEDLYQENEVPFPQTRYAVDAIWTDSPAKVARVIESYTLDVPSPQTATLLLYKGPQARVEGGAAARVGGRFYVSCNALWDAPSADDTNRSWLRRFFDELQPLASGYYINELEQEDRPERIPQCYAPSDWSRLATLRRRYDPRGVFHGFFGRADVR